MRDTTLTLLERECWRLRRAGADYREIGARLGISGERAKYETYAAKSVKEREMSDPQNLQDVIERLDQQLAELQSLTVDPAPIRQYIERLVDKIEAANKRAETAEKELADADARADIWEQNYANSNPSLYAVIRRAHDLVTGERKRADKAEAERDIAQAILKEYAATADRLRAALEKVEAFMVDDEGPIWRLYKAREICGRNGAMLPWSEALAELRDISRSTIEVGLGVEWDAVTIYREILKALERAQGGAPVSPWRPIETAPKDSTLILLYPTNGDGRISTGYWWTPVGGDSKWAAGHGWFEVNEVSHWMPLPAGPQGSEEKK